MSNIKQLRKQPSYFSILPANVRYDNRITDSERVIFAEITSFSNEYGYCTASDEYFASLYGHNKLTILNRINHLRKLGYLKITYKYIDNVLQRQIAPVLYESEGGNYE
ncbi:helix-turn-helix domain-containing protein [Staphylococcus caledonicus]|uniref:helix-turn-helix domain-containing protein n=1 Tax=Staphylococcus caledonicus TaxID=2741333 RepID=UPI0018E4DA00|nr:helix-turn-helix domain-containing protein [Staphylococcus caledonicus]MBI5973416.1 helix-turn-helix domain-containing protein [Staphylococcus caledonicus]